MKNVTQKRVYTEDEKAMFLYGSLFENYYRTGSVDYLEVSKYGNLRKKYLLSFKNAKYISAFEIVYPDMIDVLTNGGEAEFTVKVFGFDINSINSIPKHWVDFCLYVKNKVDRENVELAKEPFSVENTLKKNDEYQQKLPVQVTDPVTGEPVNNSAVKIDHKDRVISDFVGENATEEAEQETLKMLASETGVFNNKGKKISTKKRA